MKYLIASALTLICAHQTAFGQALEMPRRTCSECVITKTYNPTKKSTMVMLKPMIVADVADGKMYFMITTTYGTESSSLKKVANLDVFFVAPRLVEAKDPVLRAQTDENSINLGHLAFSFTPSSPEVSTKISSYNGMTDWHDLLKLAHAKRVEMSFDGIKFSLTDEHKSAIVDFIAYSETDRL